MIHVQLPQFEGPLGLLLYLIRRDEMDIYNIPIHHITRQYLEHIKKMRELDLEVAGDFVSMAATLIHIKSRMLLPQYDEQGVPIEDSEDPRKELVQKLLEYQKFQEASKSLNQRPLLGRDTWVRGLREDLPVDEGDIILDEGGLYSLINVYRKVLRQLSKSVHNVRAKGQSIASRILELRDRLVVGQRAVMSELLEAGEKSAGKILITFLSLLELTKMGFTNLFQTETYGEIFIDTKKPIERDVIERVEEYDKKVEQVAVLEASVVDAQIRSGLDVSSEDMRMNLQPQDQVVPEGFVADLASDEDILTAEREMGIGASEPIDLSKVDHALDHFSLEAPEAEKIADAVVPEVSTTDTTLEALSKSAEPLPLFGDDFDRAWADFERQTGISAEEPKKSDVGEGGGPKVDFESKEESDLDGFVVSDLTQALKKDNEPKNGV